VSRACCALECDDCCLPPGAFIVKGVRKPSLEKLAKELHLVFHPMVEASAETVEVKAPKVGIFQRYWGGNIDEGWTRFLLEQFEFPYATLKDDEIKAGNLKEEYDTIILPSDPEVMIIGDEKGIKEHYEKRYGGMMVMPKYPPEYRSGIGEEGAEELKKFVEAGGTLVCFDSACEQAMNRFDLNLRDVLEGVPSRDFFCPGSTLHTCVDTTHPAAYGMPADSLVFFWSSRAFEIIPSGDNDMYEVIASYPDRDILESGWLIGEDRLKRKVAMVVARYGTGRVVLIGFRPQHRAQTHGTYKLVFNSLYG
jgi:hypothetical protein